MNSRTTPAKGTIPPAHQTAAQADYATFSSLLRDALKKTIWLYFKTPVAGQQEEIFRERLFSYELYHQLRCTFDEADFGYWIGGELDKDKHPIIREGLIPDLVVHEPGDMDTGDMDRNLCVVEVKPISGAKSGFKKDLATLTAFTTKYRYHAGILLVFGDTDDGAASIRHKVGTDLQALRANRISVLWMPKAQSEPAELR